MKPVARRARRDIEAADRGGRFTVIDIELAMTIVAGAALCLGQLLHDRPDRDDAQATDQVTEDLQRMLGVPTDQARKICRRPPPDLDDPSLYNLGPRPAEPSPEPPARPTPAAEVQTNTRTA